MNSCVRESERGNWKWKWKWKWKWPTNSAVCEVDVINRNIRLVIFSNSSADFDLEVFMLSDVHSGLLPVSSLDLQ